MKNLKIPKWLLILIIVYILTFSILSIVRHEHFYSGWDLGMNEQVLWNTQNGKFFYNNDLEMNYLGNHFNIIFIFIMPIYYLFTYTNFLLILQALIIAVGVVPIYFFAKLKIKSDIAHKIIPIIYLLNPVLWLINLEDFHPIIFAVPLFLFAIYFMEKKDWTKYWIFLFLSLMVKENLSLIIAFLGIFIYFFRNKRVGLKTFFIGIIWFVVVIGMISPMFNQGGNADGSAGKYIFYTIRYSYLGDNTVSIIKTIITHPIYTLTHTNLSNKIFYVSFFIIMFAALPLFSVFSLIAIPIILQNTLTTDIVQICPNYHHSTIIIPILFIATIFSLARLEKKKYFQKILAVLLIISLVFTIFLGVGFFIINKTQADKFFMNGQRCLNNEFKFGPRAHTEFENNTMIHELLNSIPSNTTIISSQHLFSHLIKKGTTITGNPLVSNPNYDIQQEYVIIHKSDIWNDFTDKFLSNYKDKGYKKIFEERSLSVYKKD